MLARKGLSPLVATVLLIAFAVALGTMIMNWSVGVISDGESGDVCSGTALTIQELPVGSAICYDEESQHIVFLVKNTGSHHITNILMRIIDTNFDITEETALVDMQPGDLGKFSLAYETQSPNELSATIVPVILIDEEPHVCSSGEEEEIRVPVC